jgi:hypothetical protein
VFVRMAARIQVGCRGPLLGKRAFSFLQMGATETRMGGSPVTTQRRNQVRYFVVRSADK